MIFVYAFQPLLARIIGKSLKYQPLSAIIIGHFGNFLEFWLQNAWECCRKPAVLCERPAAYHNGADLGSQILILKSLFGQGRPQFVFIFGQAPKKKLYNRKTKLI